MRELFTRAPLARLPFVLFGVALFATKVPLDAAISRAFDRAYSPLLYVNPLDASVFSFDEPAGYALAMWSAALPYLALGTWLTLRRLIDASMPRWLIVLFFVPFANVLFFATVAALPSQSETRRESTSYRVPSPPPKSPADPIGRVWMAGASGAVVALGMMSASVFVAHDYGAGLFIGAPTVAGFVTTTTAMRLGVRGVGRLVAANVLALLVSVTVLVIFALEGIVCLAMAMPLVGSGVAIGGATAWVIERELARRRLEPPSRAAAIAVLPIIVLAETLAPATPDEGHVVSSEVLVDAPAPLVWDHVTAFPSLAPPREWIFALGVAYPTGATIEGFGPGAIRRCHFTTGDFVEPITVWDAPRELSFRVAAQPDPLRELTLFAAARPPHLDDYFRSTRGQFVLEPLEGGRTKLVGRTWYELDVFPRSYWRAISDVVVHAIHLRVMNEVARRAEGAARVRTQ